MASIPADCRGQGQYFFVRAVMQFRYRRPMELRQLRYFIGVAKELNFTRAAEKLHVAQPALSRQIRQLEEEVGVPLFERSARGATLTGAGKAFLKDAESLVKQSQQAMQAAQWHGRRQQGQINVGYVWGLFHTLVPRWIASFRRAHPDVAVNLFDLNALEQADAIAEGRIDLGFIGFAFEADAAHLERRKVGACAFMAALPKNHPAAKKRRVALESLSKDFFLAISETTFPGAARFLKDACRKAGFEPRIIQNVERGHTILGLVAGNCGVTLLPEPLQALPHEDVVFRGLVNPPQADLFLAWNTAKPSPVLKAFVTMGPNAHE